MRKRLTIGPGPSVGGQDVELRLLGIADGKPELRRNWATLPRYRAASYSRTSAPKHAA